MERGCWMDGGGGALILNGGWMFTEDKNLVAKICFNINQVCEYQYHSNGGNALITTKWSVRLYKRCR